MYERILLDTTDVTTQLSQQCQSHNLTLKLNTKPGNILSVSLHHSQYSLAVQASYTLLIRQYIPGITVR